MDAAEARIALANRALDGVSVAEVRDFAVRQVAEHFRSQRVTLILWDSETRAFHFRAGVGLDAELIGAEVVVADNVLKTTSAEGGVACSDMSQDGRYGRPKKLRYRSSTFMTAVIPGGAKSPKGFLCVTEPEAQDIKYQAKDLPWLQQYAATLAHVLHSAEEREAMRHQVAFEIEERRGRNLQAQLSEKTVLRAAKFQLAAAFRTGEKGVSLFSSFRANLTGGFWGLWIQSTKPHRFSLTAVSACFSLVQYAFDHKLDHKTALEEGLRRIQGELSRKEKISFGCLHFDGKKSARYWARNASTLWTYRRGEGKLNPVRGNGEPHLVRDGDWWIVPPALSLEDSKDSMKKRWNEFVISRREQKPAEMSRELISQWNRGEGDALALSVSFTSSRS